MINKIRNSFVYWINSCFCIKEIPNKNKEIFLTFDDGPEPGITESILAVLKKYNAKATFFCTGENFEKYPELVKLIISEGHTLGNHTYSHLNGLKCDDKTYIDDVFKARNVIGTDLFRPPWGVMSFSKLVKISKNNRIILWSVSSDDTKSGVDSKVATKKMIEQTKHGSIVLFHSSQKHEQRTLEILPMYLFEINKLCYTSNSI